MTVFYSRAPNWMLHCLCVTTHQNRVCYPLQLWTENLVASMVMLFWLILWLLMQLLCCWCPIFFVQSAIVARFRIQSLWWIHQVQSFVETQIKSISNFNALLLYYLSSCIYTDVHIITYVYIYIYIFCNPSKHSSFVDTLNCISIPFNMVVWFASLLFSTSFKLHEAYFGNVSWDGRSSQQAAHGIMTLHFMETSN
jgi:hypothetical protein